MANQTTKKTYEIPTTLTHLAGTITAVFPSGSRAVALSGLTAATLYYLYVRTVASVPTLFFSTTIPSTYRVSFTDAVLVGAFYSDGMASPAFGSFVTIEGVPTSDIFSYTPIWSSDGTPPVIGNGTVTGRAMRRGNILNMECQINPGGSTTFGTGNYTISILSGLTIDASKTAPGAIDIVHQMAGSGWWGVTDTGVNNYTGSRIQYHTTATLSFLYQNNASGVNGIWTPTAPFTFGNNDFFFAKGIDIPITGWTNQPLKDL